MSEKKFLVGTESFRELREENKVYIDKTGFISEFLSGNTAKVSLITRPRRFGKSLLIDMLSEFFDWRKDSRKIFDGLAVSKEKELCAKWMNKYPVIYLSLNDIKRKSFKELYEEFSITAGVVCAQYRFLLNSNKVGEVHKSILRNIISGNANNSMLCRTLVMLCEAIYDDCGLKPIIIIDEYDAPFAKLNDEKDYEDAIDFISSLFEKGLKRNKCFQFAILTGCLRISKESIFTGLNNFTCYGINDDDFADKFGFTHEEVQKLLAEKGFSEKMDIVQEWYDGYCFGSSQSIYCPWDVMQYISSLQKSPNARPKTYWKNTSSNDVVEYFLDNYMENLSDKISTLLNHGCIAADIKEDLTYKNIYDSKENIWTQLYLTGYLTKTPELQQDSDTQIRLCIPNKEIFEIFTETIESFFSKKIKGNKHIIPLVEAFWTKDDQKVSEILSAILLETISYNDYYEVYYHAFLAGIFKGQFSHTTSNYESGLGRGDIIVKDPDNNRAAVIEIKRSNTNDDMTSAADRALGQIADIKYDAPLQGEYPLILHWGIACHEKSCVAKSVAG